MSDYNPYTPPQADLTLPHDPVQRRLADRGTRLAASILDGLVLLLPTLLLIWGLYAAFDRRFWEPASDRTAVLLTFAGALLSALVYLAINGFLLARYGQSVGKRACDIRIARMDGSLPTLGESYGKRYLFVLLIGVIPVVGPLFSLLDILLIFRQSRRCLHDQIAGTMVVKA